MESVEPVLITLNGFEESVKKIPILNDEAMSQHGKPSTHRTKASSPDDAEADGSESPNEESPPPRGDGGDSEGDQQQSGPNTLRRRSGRNSQKNKKRRRSKIYNF
jgi:hypothetical protein